MAQQTEHISEVNKMMTEFSKQYCKLHNIESEGDFDIMEEFSRLEPNSYVNVICEGYKFEAIANIKGECKLLMSCKSPTGETEGKWIDYDEVVK